MCLCMCVLRNSSSRADSQKESRRNSEITPFTQPPAGDVTSFGQCIYIAFQWRKSLQRLLLLLLSTKTRFLEIDKLFVYCALEGRSMPGSKWKSSVDPAEGHNSRDDRFRRVAGGNEEMISQSSYTLMNFLTVVKFHFSEAARLLCIIQ